MSSLRIKDIHFGWKKKCIDFSLSFDSLKDTFHESALLLCDWNEFLKPQSWQLLTNEWICGFFSLNSAFWEWSVLSPWVIWQKLSLLMVWCYFWVNFKAFWNLVVYSVLYLNYFDLCETFFPLQHFFFIFLQNIKTTSVLKRIVSHSMAVRQW